MPNSLQTTSINDDTAECLDAISRVAAKRGIATYLVGGMVRDIVANRLNVASSPDITTIGDATDFASALVADIPNSHVISVSQFHTAKVRIGAVIIDIASARTDTYASWGALPRITFVNDIETDLSRRDFTMNAMATRLQPSGFSDLIDPFNGRADIADSMLRVIHDDSFREDSLRMLRGVRLVARYGYTFDTRTSELCRQSLDHLSLMIDASPERVFNEFKLWFQPHENLEAIIRSAVETGLLCAMGISVVCPHVSLNRIPSYASELQRFAAFAYNILDNFPEFLSTKLKMPSEWREAALDVASVQRVAQRCNKENVTDSQLYRSLIEINRQILQAIIWIECNPVSAERFADFQNRLRHVRTSLNGDDLIALGVKEGKMVGQLLDELLICRIRGEIASIEDECCYVIRHLIGLIGD